MEFRILKKQFKFDQKDTISHPRFKEINSGPTAGRAETLTCSSSSLFEETCLKLWSLG